MKLLSRFRSGTVLKAPSRFIFRCTKISQRNWYNLRYPFIIASFPVLHNNRIKYLNGEKV